MKCYTICKPDKKVTASLIKTILSIDSISCSEVSIDGYTILKDNSSEVRAIDLITHGMAIIVIGNADTSHDSIDAMLVTNAYIRKYSMEYDRVIIFSEENDIKAAISSGIASLLSSIGSRKALASKAFTASVARDAALSQELLKAMNKVMLLGSGGREHAIALKLSMSHSVSEVICIPGNGGTASMGGKVLNVNTIDINDNQAVISYAKQNGVSLVVVGPEQPIANGLVDDAAAAGVLCFGPTKQAGRIEASKAWSKDFMQRHSIRTAAYQNFTDYSKALAYIESIDHKVVIKASGLAAGKGVILPQSKEEAIAALKGMLLEQSFGAAGSEVVIEEFLEGEELSLLCFTDGVTVMPMPGAQDHKRVYDYDQGPNTGGMGAYAPAPIATPALLKECMRIVQTSVDAMRDEGYTYRGVLYTGFIITRDRCPAVLEYNARFGDPETQVLLPLLSSDLYDIMHACATGTLSSSLVTWHDKFACTVVVASSGYPGAYSSGAAISGIERVKADDDVTVFHAGTKMQSDGIITTAGGRVLSITGIGKSLKESVKKAYKGIGHLSFEGMHFRKDIASRGLCSPIKLGVLGSTRGSAMQPIIEAIASSRLNATISLVISNKQDAGIIGKAAAHGIKSLCIPHQKDQNREEYDRLVTNAFEQEGVAIVLMIGYMRIVSSAFTEHWVERCLNVHPSLLPDFAGGMDLQVHTAVLAANRKVSGCTIHYVTAEVDSGPILVQKTCPVNDDDTPETLKQRVQALEGPAFIDAIEMISKKKTIDHKEVITYAQAGVDIDAGESLVEAIKPYCKATRRPGCDAELGGFGGLFDLSQAGYMSDDTILVSGTDGVGTKLKIAQTIGKHDTIGIDLVAMCVNDILVCGAEPLFFLDYYACGSLDVPTAADVVKGIAAGCALGCCALIGGETAEMAGMYSHGEYDLAGFSVGAVRRSELLPRNIGYGDVLLGLPSSGVHSNGYSLVRKCVEKSGLSWHDECPFVYTGEAATLGEALLTPTKIYVKQLLPLIKQNLLKGMAHITGGGLTDNIPRVLPDDCTASIDIDGSGWVLPPVFQWLQSVANLPMQELLRTFNCGIGMVLVVGAGNVDEVLRQLGETSDAVYRLGTITNRISPTSPQVVVTGLLS